MRTECSLQRLLAHEFIHLPCTVVGDAKQEGKYSLQRWWRWNDEAQRRLPVFRQRCLLLSSYRQALVTRQLSKCFLHVWSSSALPMLRNCLPASSPPPIHHCIKSPLWQQPLLCGMWCWEEKLEGTGTSFNAIQIREIRNQCVSMPLCTSVKHSGESLDWYSRPLLSVPGFHSRIQAQAIWGNYSVKSIRDFKRGRQGHLSALH